MVTLRRSTPREQKKVPAQELNSPTRHPASIHSRMALAKTRLRLVPAAMERFSSTAPCTLRTTYQRSSLLGSSGSKSARRGVIEGKNKKAPSRRLLSSWRRSKLYKLNLLDET